jgi:hypothetical protein
VECGSLEDDRALDRGFLQARAEQADAQASQVAEFHQLLLRQQSEPTPTTTGGERLPLDVYWAVRD